MGSVVAKTVDVREDRWGGRQSCQICGEEPEFAAHPRGVCGGLVVRELALTLADARFCLNGRCRDGVVPPGMVRQDWDLLGTEDEVGAVFRMLHLEDHPEDVVRAEPTLGLLRQSLAQWADRDGRGMAIRFVAAEELGLGGGRAMHPHCHLLCLGSQCAIEVARLRWAETFGNAHGKRAHPVSPEEWPEHLGRYEAKHVSKQQYGLGTELRVWFHSEVSQRRGIVEPWL